MALDIYSTSNRRKERFVPGDPGRMTLYVCGPTVYNYPHIGNARPEVVFDVLARLLRRTGQLVYARNLTDVDDKINAAARREGVDIAVLTARYVDAYRADMAALGVLPPDIEPRATRHIEVIVRMIQRLIESGHAYEAEGHVLFSVSSYSGYGALSRRSVEDMVAGARVEVAPYKRDPADFVLWKPSEPELVGWESPWGRGRPGWHIECSAMVEAHLGETIDIHGGGLDLVFPHHENEAAQSVCAHGGRPFARYWMHNGLVNMGSEKMSKSVGNMVLVRELLQSVDGEVVRLGLLNAHYRQPLEWSEQLVQDSKQKLDRMYGALRDAGVHGRADSAGDGAGVRRRPGSSRDASEMRDETGEAPPAAVLAALEDDLNTPQALAELFGLARAANRAEDPAEKAALARSLRAGAQLLGLLSKDPAAWFASTPEGETGHGGLAADEIDALVERREALRRERNFAAADAIR
ncbi:MAG TPA: cysteine--tRNA ligase, partial [Gammaproteobacteria bacterium]|nr:cysteine--tRNA ligase [Gammaproteobacteria bacterium]